MADDIDRETGMDMPPLDWRRVLFVALLFLSWEGVVPAIIGLPISLGRYAVGALVLVGVGLSAMRFIVRPKISRARLGSSWFFLYCVAVTVIYSGLVHGLPPREWLFAQYMLLPLLIGYLFVSLRIGWRDIVFGMLVAATLCSVISLADQVLRLPQFDQFARGSINSRGVRRMFLMRVETGFSIVLLSAWLFLRWKMDRKAVLALLVLALNVLVLFGISESRQSMLTTSLALLFFVLFARLRPMRVLKVGLAGLFIGLPLVVFLARDILERLVTSDDYIVDGNISIRFQAIDFYMSKWTETYGFGFGVLSNGDDASNFFAQAWRIGNGYWGYMIADTGIVSALTQFGWIGLTLVLLISFRLAVGFIRIGRALPQDQRFVPIALGCFLLGSMVNPWPMNYFTLEWTILFGSACWFAYGNMLDTMPALRPTSAIASKDHREMRPAAAPG